MKYGSRWQRLTSYSVVGAWLNAAYADDDEFTIEDIDETFYAAGMLGLIWSPQIALAVPALAAASGPLAVVEGAALVGLGASFVIGGYEGAETYVDYINPTNLPELITDPGKQESLMQAHRIMQGVVTLGGSELARAGVATLSDYKDEIFKNRFMTGPYLPF